MSGRALAALLLTAFTATSLSLAPAGAWGANLPTGLSVWQVAGNGQACGGPVCGDGAVATSGMLTGPAGVTTDPAGNVYVIEAGSHQLRRLSPTGVLTTYTTSGAFERITAAGGQTAYDFGSAYGLQYHAGSLYVARTSAKLVVRVTGTGVTTIAGDGNPCGTPTCGDGPTATSAQLTEPTDVVVDDSGNVYIADAGDNKIRKVSPAGAITTIAGDGTPCGGGTCGDGVAHGALTSPLDGPGGLAVTPDGSRLYIADTNDARVRVLVGDTIDAFAGGGCGCFSSGDNEPALSATLEGPIGLALEPGGGLLIADPTAAEVRRVGTDGDITRVAGAGDGPCTFAHNHTCDAGQAFGATLGATYDVAVDSDGHLLVTDISNGVLLWLAPSQPLGTAGPKGDKGDPGPAGPAGPTGPAGANGLNGTNGLNGASSSSGTSGGGGVLGTWLCARRRQGIGRFAVSCFAKASAPSGARVTAELTRDDVMVARDTATARNGVAGLHLRSSARLAGVYTLRLTIDPAGGATRMRSIRVVI